MSDFERTVSSCAECVKTWNARFTQGVEVWMKHWEKDHRKRQTKYAFSFTTGAEREAWPAKEEAFVEAVQKLFRQESVPIKEGAAYLEYGEDGRPHVHGWYSTTDGGRVFSKVFHRCWPEWAEKRGKTKFAGGFHEVMKSDRYIGYANAEGRELIKKSEA